MRTSDDDRQTVPLATRVIQGPLTFGTVNHFAKIEFKWLGRRVPHLKDCEAECQQPENSFWPVWYAGESLLIPEFSSREQLGKVVQEQFLILSKCKECKKGP